MVVCLLFKLKEMAATFIGKTVNMPGHTWIQLDSPGCAVCILLPLHILFHFISVSIAVRQKSGQNSHRLEYYKMRVISLSARKGLYISDVPLHDAARDLVLLSEKFEAEYKLTKNLEMLTDKLQQTFRDLESEKQKTDR